MYCVMRASLSLASECQRRSDALAYCVSAGHKSFVKFQGFEAHLLQVADSWEKLTDQSVQPDDTKPTICCAFLCSDKLIGSLCVFNEVRGFHKFMQSEAGPRRL